jgi:hypothetical protein
MWRIPASRDATPMITFSFELAGNFQQNPLPPGYTNLPPSLRDPHNVEALKMGNLSYGEDDRRDKGDLTIRIVLQPSEELRNAIDLIIVTTVGK